MLERIKWILDHYNVSAAQFADQIGVQRSAVSHVLSMRNKPSLDFLLKIKKSYPGLNLDWLALGSGQPLVQTDDVPESKREDRDGKKDVRNVGGSNQQKELTFESSDVDESREPELSLSNADVGVNMPINSEKKRIARVILLFADGSFEHYELGKH